MADQVISVTVDAALLQEIQQLGGTELDLSSIVNSGLQRLLRRLRMAALLDEMELQKPISKRGQEHGQRLWRRTKLS